MAEKLGVLMVGANGSVATAVTAGVSAIRRGIVRPYGLVTSMTEFASLDLVTKQNSN